MKTKISAFLHSMAMITRCQLCGQQVNPDYNRSCPSCGGPLETVNEIER